MKRKVICCLMTLLFIAFFPSCLKFEHHVTFNIILENPEIQNLLITSNLNNKDLDCVKVGDYYVFINLLDVSTTGYNYTKDKEKLNQNLIKKNCHIELFSAYNTKINGSVISITSDSSLGKQTFLCESKFFEEMELRNDKIYWSSSENELLEFPVGKDGKFSLEAKIMIDEKIYEIKYNYVIKRKEHFIRLLD